MQNQARRSARLKQRSRDLRLLMVAFSLLSIIRLGLLMLPFRSLVKLLDQITPAPPVQSTQLSVEPGAPSFATVNNRQHKAQIRKIAKVVWAINHASRYMPGGVKCLARALATQVLINRHQQIAELRIGVDNNSDQGFRAHAWIEYQGQVIIGNLQDLSSFTPLPDYRGFQQ